MLSIPRQVLTPRLRNTMYSCERTGRTALTFWRCQERVAKLNCSMESVGVRVCSSSISSAEAREKVGHVAIPWMLCTSGSILSLRVVLRGITAHENHAYLVKKVDHDTVFHPGNIPTSFLLDFALPGDIRQGIIPCFLEVSGHGCTECTWRRGEVRLHSRNG